MNKFARIFAGIFAAVVGLGLLHGILNLGWGTPRPEERYRVSFLPVT